MSLYPGGRESGHYSLDDAALSNSMAKLMEDEFAAVYQAVKSSPLPPSARQDMRIFFVAVARGVLRYLNENQSGNIIAQPASALPHQHQVNLAVNLEQA